MSIRIRNGRVVHAGLSRAYDLLIAAKPGAETIGRGLQTSWMARHAAAAIDAVDIKGAEMPYHPLAAAWQALMDADREIKATGRRNPDCDYEFELWILPLSDRRTLMIVQTERREFLRWLDALPFVEDHSYWDDVDRPEDMTGAAWRRRKREWDAVMPRSVPSDRCLTMTMFNHGLPTIPKPAEALRHIADRAARAESHARVLHVDERYRLMLDAKRAKDPGFQPRGFELYFKAEAEAREDVARRAEIVTDVASRLRDIGVTDLAPRD